MGQFLQPAGERVNLDYLIESNTSSQISLSVHMHHFTSLCTGILFYLKLSPPHSAVTLYDFHGLKKIIIVLNKVQLLLTNECSLSHITFVLLLQTAAILAVSHFIAKYGGQEGDKNMSFPKLFYYYSNCTLQEPPEETCLQI